MPFARLSHQGRNRLMLLHRLTDVISFREQFFQRLSDRSFNRDSITQITKSDNHVEKGHSKVFALKHLSGYIEQFI
jgi:hypothetical protein